MPLLNPHHEIGFYIKLGIQAQVDGKSINFGTRTKPKNFFKVFLQSKEYMQKAIKVA